MESRNVRRVGIGFLILGLGGLGCCLLPYAPYWRWNLSSQSSRHAKLQELAEETQPLIQAIERYYLAHGEPPVRLEDLVPTEIASIPAGWGKDSGKTYRRFEDPDRPLVVRRVWYDLGATSVDPLPIPATREQDGEPDRGVLRLFLYAADEVVFVRVARVPQDGELPFDELAWREGRERLLMGEVAGSLVWRQTLEQATALLGPPDGEVEVLTDGWYLAAYLERFVFDIDAPSFGYEPSLGHWAGYGAN